MTVRVLVAEDDTAVRDALVAMIEAEPALRVAAVAADAQGAIDAAAAETPDVALLDVRMPGGGPRAARGIRKRSPQTRVLALSGHDDRATVLEMLEAGAVGYLVKGCSVDTIVESIRRAALGQSSLSVEVVGEVVDELVHELAVRRRLEARSRAQERRIRRALESDGAVTLVYQPICTLQGATVGAEALARFRKPPQRGPDLWFAEADQVGLREDLEIAVAASALGALPDLPPDAFLSINVSPATICLERFQRALDGVAPGRVVVEITEHARIADYEAIGEALDALRACGVAIAIDDAGAGYASLRHILQLEPDYIKLDRALISGIDRERTQQALAVGLISFAESIGAMIVAEGIERPEELSALARLGVPYGQGYFLGRPGALPLPPRSLHRVGSSTRPPAGGGRPVPA